MTLIYRRDFKKAPDVVAYPRDEEDIAAIFDWCGKMVMHASRMAADRASPAASGVPSATPFPGSS
jgi:hypothetical protein